MAIIQLLWSKYDKYGLRCCFIFENIQIARHFFVIFNIKYPFNVKYSKF